MHPWLPSGFYTKYTIRKRVRKHHPRGNYRLAGTYRYGHVTGINLNWDHAFAQQENILFLWLISGKEGIGKGSETRADRAKPTRTCSYAELWSRQIPFPETLF